MGLFDDLPRRLHVLLEGKMRRVDHHRTVMTRANCLETTRFVAMVQMDGEIDFGINFFGRLDHPRQHCRVGVASDNPGELDDDRRLRLGRATKETVDLLHVADVERSQSVAAVSGSQQFKRGEAHRNY
jgi:hypothetical protein